MAAISNSLSLLYPLLVFFFIQLWFLSPSAAAKTGGGFTVELIHRDSPLSPFYNPSTTKLDRLSNAFRRSISRAARFKLASKSPEDIQSQIVPTSGEYLMKLSIGTPPFQMLGIADTGSDLTWTQCQPCTQCYKQISPFFDPKKSSTYKALSCDSQACQAVGTSSCSDSQSICHYTMSYGDQSYTEGDLAVETFTFGSNSGRAVSIPKMVFGCGHNDDGTFNETADGIIGLGGGSLSIVNQLSGSINGKFSYCLAPLDSDSNVTSKINFGDHAAVSGSGVLSTPIVKKSPDTFYYLTLESITVGNKSLAYKAKKESKSGWSSADDEGNIIIDSGTTLTLLPSDFYGDLESEVKQVIKGDPTPDPQGFLSLCYSSNGDNLNLPTLTVKFSGAEMELPPSSTFIQNGDLVCLAMIPSDDLAIFGNLSQMNFLIGYDLVKNQLSFMPTDCTKH